MMNYCGIVLAKKNSNRLPNKNFLDILFGLPSHQIVFSALSEVLNDVYTFSDHMDYSNRPPAASLDDEPIFEALKWAYKSLPKRYDAIVTILANCPMHTADSVACAISRFEKLGCQELRSFNQDGSESGLMILKEEYLLKKHEVSTYQGAIGLESIEIHTKEDFEKCQSILLQKSGRTMKEALAQPREWWIP